MFTVDILMGEGRSMSAFQWTGNPFVDTGLCVLIARAKKIGKQVTTIDDLTLEVLRDVVGDGSWLAEMNKRLKSYTMVFGNNGPLTQTGTNPLSQLASHEHKIREKKQEILDVDNQIQDLTKQLDAEANQRKQEQLRRRILKARVRVERLRKTLLELESKIDAKRKKAVSGFDRGVEEYKIVINTLLEDVLTGAHSLNTICEGSGLYKATRALSVASERIRQIGAERKDKSMSKREDFEVGRDWFPLAGSFNDAQALPAASRSANLSALCLLAVQFLPPGVLLLDRHLVCFQTNDVAMGKAPIFQFLVEDIYKQLTDRSQAQSGKLDTLGKRQGTTPTALLLFQQFEMLQRFRRRLRLPDYITLNILKFSNSGTSPECDVTEVPNAALQFLWEAARLHSQELESFLRTEGNNKEFQLLTRIQREQRYPSFYPRTIRDSETKKDSVRIASRGLFELYSKRVLKLSDETLRTAEWIAKQMKRRLQSKKEAKTLTAMEKSLGDSQKIADFYAPIKGHLAEFAESGLLTLDEYLSLFPSQLHPLKADMNSGMRLIWFYLNLNDTAQAQRATITGENQSMFTHPKIRDFAGDMFRYYTQEKKWSLSKFKTHILEGFRRNAINNWDVQQWFLNLAETHDGYTNEDWDDLCRDDAGNNITHEVMFQMRLELANLYRLANRDGSIMHP
jgi:hypothetical protein